MKNLIAAILLIFLISCKKESEKQLITDNKEYIFDYNKEKISDDENPGRFLNNKNYEIDRYIQLITKDEYLQDFLNYKNSLDVKKYKFNNNSLETNYGRVKFIPSDNRNVDSFVAYSYSGFAESIDSHIINLNLYEGERTLVLSNKNYHYTSISSPPLIFEEQKICSSL